MEREVGNLMRERVPWLLKIATKLLLSRLPIPYRGWRSIGIFKHGSMLDWQYALKVFQKHYDHAKPYLPANFTVLELGPGDSLATSLIAAANHATKTYLVDIGKFASMEMETYNHLSQSLANAASGRTILTRFRTVSEMLEVTNTTYLTLGLESLLTIPDDSVDFVFSQAVLEHIALNDFAKTIEELFRLQKPGGVASHRVDLEDHLSHSLYSLRFSRHLWESKVFATSGFYTNRLRASQILETVVRSGYKVLDIEEDRWISLPLQRKKLHPDFVRFSDDDLMIRALDVLIQKKR